MVIFCLYELWSFIVFLLIFVMFFAGLQKNLQVTYEGAVATPFFDDWASYLV